MPSSPILTPNWALSKHFSTLNLFIQVGDSNARRKTHRSKVAGISWLGEHGADNREKEGKTKSPKRRNFGPETCNEPCISSASVGLLSAGSRIYHPLVTAMQLQGVM